MTLKVFKIITYLKNDRLFSMISSHFGRVSLINTFTLMNKTGLARSFHYVE